MNKIFKISCVFIVSLVLFSCKKSEIKIEEEKLNVFSEKKEKLYKSVIYLQDKYFPIYAKENSSITIILSDNNGVRNNIYYDNYLKKKLNDINIKSISFRKSNKECSGYDIEIFYELYPLSERQYYYVFTFCDNNSKKIEESLSYKIIPLANNWKLEIEKK